MSRHGGELEGRVEEALPRGLFRVRLDGGQIIRAALSSQVRRIIIKLIAGDRVLVKLHPHDPTRGRITQRL